MRKLKIACIGTRDEEDKNGYLFRIGAYLAKLNIQLISGNAVGSDYLFACGANSINPKLVKLYLPWESYNKSQIVTGNTVVVDINHIEAHTLLAEKHHKYWNKLSNPIKKLMIRNAAIIDNSDAVIANPGNRSYGTQHGMNIAEDLGKPLINIAKSSDVKLEFLQFIEKLLNPRNK